MKKIGFVDYYLSEWHANNYPAWIEEACANAENQLLTVFKDGKLLVEQNLQQVRAKLHNGKF